jgi:hypothetical protein
MSATVRDELAGKPANEVEQSSKESVGRRQGPSGMRTSKTRAGHRTGEACQLGWIGPHRTTDSALLTQTRSPTEPYCTARFFK